MALITGGLVALVLSGFTLAPKTTYSAPQARVTATPSASPKRTPVVAFIGDSYTAGSDVRWTSLVAKTKGWREINLGRGGTGYEATAGKAGCGLDYCPPYGEMAAKAIAAKPDVVFVAGGRNDGGVYPAKIKAVFADLRRGLPDAKIYAVSPVWDDDPAPGWLARQSKAVKAAVSAAGGTFLDIGEPLSGHPKLITADGIHPNAEGYQALAAAVLRELG